jgi:hypothetical protein
MTILSRSASAFVTTEATFRSRMTRLAQRRYDGKGSPKFVENKIGLNVRVDKQLNQDHLRPNKVMTNRLRPTTESC